MITDKFSWSRVWALIVRYVYENKRNLLMTVGVMFGIMLFFDLVYYRNINENYNELSLMVLATFMWISMIAIQVTGSLTFSSLSTKPRRISSLMVPASKLEKFTSLVMIYTVAGNLVILLCGFVADTISALLFGRRPAWLQIDLMDFIQIFKDFDSWNSLAVEVVCGVTLGLIALILITQAIYVLGSSLWPRKSFLKTFLVLFILQTILPIFLSFGMLINGMDWIFNLETWENVNYHILGWSCVAASWAFLIFIYWLAWRRFRSIQVVQKFMMN